MSVRGVSSSRRARVLDHGQGVKPYQRHSETDGAGVDREASSHGSARVGKGRQGSEGLAHKETPAAEAEPWGSRSSRSEKHGGSFLRCLVETMSVRVQSNGRACFGGTNELSDTLLIVFRDADELHPKVSSLGPADRRELNFQGRFLIGDIDA